VTLLEGRPAPFSGLLIDADAAEQCIEDAAAVDRLTVELAVAQRVLQQSTTLYEQHINEQESRILQLSTTSWWEQNGNIIMLTLGLILGVVGAAVVVGLAN
jgi:7-cyano-7-deazaguanine synthase in queuosine biosynthesis